MIQQIQQTEAALIATIQQTEAALYRIGGESLEDAVTEMQLAADAARERLQKAADTVKRTLATLAADINGILAGDHAGDADNAILYASTNGNRCRSFTCQRTARRRPHPRV